MDTEKATHEITRMAALITKLQADSDHVYGSSRILASGVTPRSAC